MRREGDASEPKLLQDVEVSFDRPSDGFAPTPATIDLFLYELREDTELRTNEPERFVDTQTGTVRNRRPPLRLDCCYLLTAWPATGQANAAMEELRLLGEAIRVLARHEVIPVEYRQGEIRGMEPPPRVQIGISATERGRGLGEFWSAVGNKLRPSILLRVTIAVDTNLALSPAPDFLTTTANVRVQDKDSVLSTTAREGERTFFHVGGRVQSAGIAVVGATVRIAALDKSTITDGNGVFRFASLPKGTYDAIAEVTGLDGVPMNKAFRLQVPMEPNRLAFIDFSN